MSLSVRRNELQSRLVVLWRQMNDLDAAASLVALGLAPRRWPKGSQLLMVDQVLHDSDVSVRVAALGALIRRATPNAMRSAWDHAITDIDPAVRRRAAELAPELDRRTRRSDTDAIVGALLARLGDRDPLVCETSAWALGELESADAVERLTMAATGHSDALVREAAVAALGAIAHEDGIDAILAACNDKPAIRRRAVLALAPFEGPRVSAAIEAALDDRDWQVRQAAEDLRSPG